MINKIAGKMNSVKDKLEGKIPLSNRSYREDQIPASEHRRPFFLGGDEDVSFSNTI